MELNAENMWVSKYWHPAVAVDAVVFGFDPERRQLAVLLVERGKDPYKGAWALPGGFITQNDPSTKDAMLRELKEETNVEGVEPIEFHTFSDAGRDPRERVISIAYFTLTRVQEVLGADDARTARWFPIGELPPLAFDHQQMFEQALQRLSDCLKLKTGNFFSGDFSYEEIDMIYFATLTKR